MWRHQANNNWIKWMRSRTLLCFFVSCTDDWENYWPRRSNMQTVENQYSGSDTASHEQSSTSIQGQSSRNGSKIFFEKQKIKTWFVLFHSHEFLWWTVLIRSINHEGRPIISLEVRRWTSEIFVPFLDDVFGFGAVYWSVAQRKQTMSIYISCLPYVL